MLQPGWSLVVLRFPSSPVHLPIFWGSFQVHQLQLVSPSPFMFHSFFISLARSWYLFHFSPSFDFNLFSARTAMSTIPQFSFCWLSLGLVVWPRYVDPFVSKRSFCVSFSRTDSGLCIKLSYGLSFFMLKLLVQFTVDHFPRPVVSSLIFFLCLFATFASYMIDHLNI